MDSPSASKRRLPINCHRPFIIQSLCWGRSANFLYLANAKAGSSNIKRALIISALKRGADLKDKATHGGGWWDDPTELSSDKPYTFTIVRNPYTRILSAYLDKICRRCTLREQFYWQHSIPRNENIRFEEFLKLLYQPGVILDQHYRPQVENIFLGGIHIDAVFPLENYASFVSEIRDSIKDFRDDHAAEGASTYQKHATNSSDKISAYYTSDAAAMVREIYHDDFEAFGYSTNISELRDAPAPLRNCELADKAYPGLVHAALAASRPKGVSVAEETLSGECETASGRFFQRALLLKGMRGSASLDGMAEEASALLSSARYPIERYVALDLGANARLAREEWREALEALDEMLHVAPYFPYPQARAMRILARTGRDQEARERLDWLRQMTLQKERYAKVLQEESDAAAADRSVGKKTYRQKQEAAKSAAMPDITRKLVRFVARRLAGVDPQEWKGLPQDVRNGYIDQASTALGAERQFYEQGADKGPEGEQ